LVDPPHLIQLEADPVVEPTCQWRSPLTGGVCASGGACSPMDESVPVEEHVRRWSRASVRSPLVGALFFRGTGMEVSAADPMSGGAVEDVGAPPPLSWSRGIRPVLEEDAPTTTVLAGDGGLDGPLVHRSPEGRAWRMGGRLRTMWLAAAWWNPSSYGMDVGAPRRCCGVTGPGRSPRRMRPQRRCWPATMAWMARQCAVL
jgi:hypothetical protein